MSEPNLFKKLVKFGKGHEVEAVYEDTLPTGSSIGTVIAFHGAPGSHNDFKFIKEKLVASGIRFIGLNYPGFTYTKSYAGQNFENADRQMYSDALLEKLEITGRIVYMGHSRGCENALQTAVEKNGYGLVMINPVGLRIHRAVSPKEHYQRIEKHYDSLPKQEANEFIFSSYKAAGFRVTNSEECISALRTINRFMLNGQLPFIEKLNQLKTKVLFLCAGQDHMIEPEITLEVIQKYKLKHYEFEEDPNVEEVLRSFQNSGKGSTVFIQKDNHFQNKFRADLIAKSIDSMFLSNKHKL